MSGQYETLRSTPRIALPEPTSTDAAYNQRVWAAYFHSLAASGAIGIPIPLTESPATIARLVWSCCGILLPGSPADVDPQKYGQACSAECGKADPVREAVDELLLQDAFNMHKPLLGICFGAQMLNVWKGGSLVQHLPSLSTVQHDLAASVLEAHSVKVQIGSLLGEIAHCGGLDKGTGETLVNSSHHQAIDRHGDGLIVSGLCSADGVIEAIEGTSPDHFVLGVQWHPERTFDSSRLSRGIFQAFVEAAARYQPRVIRESIAAE